MILKYIMNLALGIIVINDGELRVFMEDNNYNWAINLVRYGNPIKVMAELNQFRSRTVKYKTAKGNLLMEILNLIISSPESKLHQHFIVLSNAQGRTLVINHRRARYYCSLLFAWVPALVSAMGQLTSPSSFICQAKERSIRRLDRGQVR